jgi:ABC-type oligopeptide transport system substrate-binding subunit
MEAINAREVAYAPLYFTNRAFLVHPSVRGWRDNPIERIEWRDLYLAP